MYFLWFVCMMRTVGVVLLASTSAALGHEYVVTEVKDERSFCPQMLTMGNLSI